MDDETNPSDKQPESHNELVYDLVVDSLLVLFVAVNVYLIIDAATEGELTRSVVRRWHDASRQAVTYWHTFVDRDKVVRTAEYFANHEGDQ